jgi:hypothetical protein
MYVFIMHGILAATQDSFFSAYDGGISGAQADSKSDDFLIRGSLFSKQGWQTTDTSTDSGTNSDFSWHQWVQNWSILTPANT